jgi:translation elongation factor EF-Tu-like GTPase
VNELLLLIEDMFQIKDRGYVAAGNVSSGPIRVGDRVWVPTVQGCFRFEIVQIQSIIGPVEQAEQGEQVGLLLEGDGGEHLQRGHVLCRDTYPHLTL